MTNTQDLPGSTYLVQCSFLKPEMSLELVVKCDAAGARESGEKLTQLMLDTLAPYLR